MTEVFDLVGLNVFFRHWIVHVFGKGVWNVNCLIGKIWLYQLVRFLTDASNKVCAVIPRIIVLRIRVVIPNVPVRNRTNLFNFVCHLPYPNELSRVCEEKKGIRSFCDKKISQQLWGSEPINRKNNKIIIDSDWLVA